MSFLIVAMNLSGDNSLTWKLPIVLQFPANLAAATLAAASSREDIVALYETRNKY